MLFLLIYSEILLIKSRYEVGLEKLDAAAAEVAVMQSALEALQPKLVDAANKVAETVKQVEKEKAEAAEVEKVVMVDEELANEQVCHKVNIYTCFTIEFRNKPTAIENFSEMYASLLLIYRLVRLKLLKMNATPI